jgi:hypothetical protein
MGRLPLLVNGNVPLCVRAIAIVAKGDISRISLEFFHFVSHCYSLLSCFGGFRVFQNWCRAFLAGGAPAPLDYTKAQGRKAVKTAEGEAKPVP